MRKLSPILLSVVILAVAVVELRAASEPFGHSKIVLPGEQHTEWQKVLANVEAAKREIEECLREPDRCDDGRRKFIQIVKEASGRNGRNKIEFVNEQINGQLHYTPDAAQWGNADADIWSLPLGLQGSFNKQAGDCEDFVLAKYGVLSQAGVPDENLRMLLVHDSIVRKNHAVLAIFDEGKWLILDNRWNKVVEDKELWNFKPLFVVEKTGVHMLAKAFRLNDFVKTAPPPARAQSTAARRRTVAGRS
jgi:predicted transglutaminase-like cysteine proteinase